MTRFDLTLDQTVAIRKSFYPPPSISLLFAELGGCLGLWLGIGLVQLGLNGLTFLSATLVSLKSN